MIRSRLKIPLLIACMFGASGAGAQCVRTDEPSQPIQPVELSAPAGALRLLEGAGAEAGRRYVFSGASLPEPSSPSPVSGERVVTVVAHPAAWGTRLVSEGAGPVRVDELDSQLLQGSLINGSRGTVGGLVRLPKADHRWAAFVVQATPREDLAALEFLYALVLRADTGGLYTLQMSKRCADPVGAAKLSQSDLLHEIARLRNLAAAQIVDGRATLRPWDVVSLRPSPTEKPLQPNEVRAVVEDASGSLAGALVIFSRAPHFGCATISDRLGIATCILQDTHGDMDEDDDGGPVVATFSGIISEVRLVPPMTTVVRQ